jgi:hypothetical protein
MLGLVLVLVLVPVLVLVQLVMATVLPGTHAYCGCVHSSYAWLQHQCTHSCIACTHATQPHFRLMAVRVLVLLAMVPLLPGTHASFVCVHSSCAWLQHQCTHNYIACTSTIHQHFRSMFVELLVLVLLATAMPLPVKHASCGRAPLSYAWLQHQHTHSCIACMRTTRRHAWQQCAFAEFVYHTSLDTLHCIVRLSPYGGASMDGLRGK